MFYALFTPSIKINTSEMRLPESNVGAYKGAVFKIIEAINEEITYLAVLVLLWNIKSVSFLPLKVKSTRYKFSFIPSYFNDVLIDNPHI